MIRRLLEALGAWRRNEVRKAPATARGRVYAKKDEAGGALPARTKLKAALAPTRVYRAAEDAWYRVNPETGNLEKEE